jgi:hypothetical protein
MLLSQSFANLKLIWKQVLAYLAGVAVLAFAVPLVGEEVTSLAGFALYFVGQYWLYHALLKARGLVETSRIRFFAFIGLGLLLIFPILFGIALFVLPGLFLAARWIAAPAFIVARGERVFAAAGSSWQAVRSHTGKIAGIIVLFFLAVSVLGSLTSGFDGSIADIGAYRDTKLIDVIELHLYPLLLLGLSTATYELLGPEDNSIEEVFG